MNATKALEIFLSGGSSVAYAILAAVMFFGDTTFGMSPEKTYQFIGYVSILYLMIQGLQFNMARVDTVRAAGVDIILSLVPFLVLFYVFVTVDIGDTMWYYIRNVMMLTTIVDILIFGWASLKMLLYTDKNAKS